MADVSQVRRPHGIALDDAFRFHSDILDVLHHHGQVFRHHDGRKQGRARRFVFQRRAGGCGCGLGALDHLGVGVFHGGRIQGAGGESRLGQRFARWSLRFEKCRQVKGGREDEIRFRCLELILCTLTVRQGRRHNAVLLSPENIMGSVSRNDSQLVAQILRFENVGEEVTLVG